MWWIKLRYDDLGNGTNLEVHVNSTIQSIVIRASEIWYGLRQLHEFPKRQVGVPSNFSQITINQLSYFQLGGMSHPSGARASAFRKFNVICRQRPSLMLRLVSQNLCIEKQLHSQS